MRRPSPVALAVSLVALTVIVMLMPASLAAQEVGQTKEVAPGISVKNLAEVPTDIPGYEKVRIVELTMQPGASLPSGTKMAMPMFCTVLKGQVTFKVDGTDTTYKAGDSYVCRIGQTFEGKNTGSEPYVERMHQLIPPGQR